LSQKKLGYGRKMEEWFLPYCNTGLELYHHMVTVSVKC
jgi:hypothetical protein